MRQKRKNGAKLILGMITFVFGVLGGAGIAMWLMPPL
jgi:hypothetical protein